MTNKTFKPEQIPGLEKAADAASVFEYYVPNTTFDSETGQYFAYGGGDYAEGVDPEKKQAYIDKAMQDPTKWVANNLNWSGLGDRGDFSALDDQIKFLKDNNYDTKTLYQPGLTQYNLTKQIIGQGTTGRWSGEGFGNPIENAKHMASTLMTAGIDDIKDFGKIKKTYSVDLGVAPEYRYDGDNAVPTGRYYFTDDADGSIQYFDAKDVQFRDAWDPEGGMQKVAYAKVQLPMQEVYGNKKTQQAITQDYNGAYGNYFSGTYAGHGRTNFGVQFAADGTPYFYTQFGGDTSSMSDIAPILTALSIVPSPLQPFAAAANALIAIDNGNTLGGLAALAGIPGVSEAASAAGLANVVSGIETANKVAGLVNAIESGNIAGIISSANVIPGVNIGSTAIGDTGLTVADAMKSANLVKAIESGDANAIFKATTSFANSPTIKDALKQTNTPVTSSGEKVADVVGNDFVADITNPNSNNFLGNTESTLQDIISQPGVQLASSDNEAALKAIEDINKKPTDNQDVQDAVSILGETDKTEPVDNQDAISILGGTDTTAPDNTQDAISILGGTSSDLPVDTSKSESQWQPDNKGNVTFTADDGSTLTLGPDGEVIDYTNAPEENLPGALPAPIATPAPSSGGTKVPVPVSKAPVAPSTPSTSTTPAAQSGMDVNALMALLGMVGGTQAQPQLPEVVYAKTPEFDITKAFSPTLYEEEQKQENPYLRGLI